MKRWYHWVGSVVLPLMVLVIGFGLAAWKYDAIQEGQAASAKQPEPMETVTVAVAKEIEHRQSTTSIGTVLALRSITLKNEIAGTVREVHLTPGQVVEGGTVLVALDVSVEEAELKAQSPRYAALTQPAPLGLTEIQTAVTDDATLLLEYSLGEKRSYLWAVTPTSIESFELPGRDERSEPEGSCIPD